MEAGVENPPAKRVDASMPAVRGSAGALEEEGERETEGEGVLVEGGAVAADEREGERVETGGEAVALEEALPPTPPPPPPAGVPVTVCVGGRVGGRERDLAVRVGRVVVEVLGVEEAHAVTIPPSRDAVPVALPVALAVPVLR